MQIRKEGRKDFFFEKKKQKTFLLLGPGEVATSRVNVTNVFCGAFFQKSDRFLKRSVP
jgi:hypothetical protein